MNVAESIHAELTGHAGTFALVNPRRADGPRRHIRSSGRQSASRRAAAKADAARYIVPVDNRPNRACYEFGAGCFQASRIPPSMLV
jgi:hypothetical protein